jgi:sulfite exporter TauE/SafE
MKTILYQVLGGLLILVGLAVTMFGGMINVMLVVLGIIIILVGIGLETLSSRVK